MEAASKIREKERVIAVRKLYECSHGRVYDSRIYCDRGYRLSMSSYDGSLGINRLVRGMPLAQAVCQNCPYFDCMGPPIADNEKGWLDSYEVKK